MQICKLFLHNVSNENLSEFRKKDLNPGIKMIENQNL